MGAKSGKVGGGRPPGPSSRLSSHIPGREQQEASQKLGPYSSPLLAERGGEGEAGGAAAQGVPVSTPHGSSFPGPRPKSPVGTTLLPPLKGQWVRQRMTPRNVLLT